MTILHVIKNICVSWLEVKRSTVITIWKKLIPTLMGESETFKTSAKKVPADVTELIRSRIRGGAGSYDRIAVISG